MQMPCIKPEAKPRMTDQNNVTSSKFCVSKIKFSSMANLIPTKNAAGSKSSILWASLKTSVQNEENMI